MIKSILTTLSALVLSTTMALAATTPTPTTPEITPPVTATCSSGSSWSEGKDAFDKSATSQGGSFLAQMNEDDGSFAILYDFRNGIGVDPEYPIFVLIFDQNECFVTSLFFSVQQIQDAYGIVLASD